jgi:L-amino acid N-acyltransferase YncA
VPCDVRDACSSKAFRNSSGWGGGLSRLLGESEVKEGVLEIRAASQDDLPAIVAIYNQAIACGLKTGDIEPVTVPSRRAWFEEHDSSRYPIFVAEEMGAVVGYATLSAYRPGRAALRRTAEVSYYVDENCQRRGVGTRVLRHAIEQARGLGFKTLLAVVIEANLGSVALLKNFGFEQWGLLPNIVEHQGASFGHVYLGLRIDAQLESRAESLEM